MNARSRKSKAHKRPSGRPAAPLRLEGMEFTLPAELGIEHATKLHATLAPLLATLEPVVLAAHDVRKLHTATLQVLAAFIRERTAAGGLTTLNNPSALLRESATRLGLDAALGLAPISSN